MKLGFFLSLYFVLNGLVLHAQNPAVSPTPTTIMTAKFKVFGNCGMCEKRIEKAAKIEGVETAEWDVETKILSITFDRSIVKPSKVHQALAAVGHDTESVKADDKTYARLHSCCQYDRQ